MERGRAPQGSEDATEMSYTKAVSHTLSLRKHSRYLTKERDLLKRSGDRGLTADYALHDHIVPTCLKAFSGVLIQASFSEQQHAEGLHAKKTWEARLERCNKSTYVRN